MSQKPKPKNKTYVYIPSQQTEICYDQLCQDRVQITLYYLHLFCRINKNLFNFFNIQAYSAQVSKQQCVALNPAWKLVLYSLG